MKPRSLSSASACGAAQPGLEHREPRLLVELDQRVHAPQVERHDAGEAAGSRLEPADHGRAAAERHHGDPPLRAHPQACQHLVVRTRQQHQIRRIRGFAGAQPQEVGERLAAGVANARLVV